ncbi:MAG TPA: BamA/TamA family outer membrane protein [Candidatus Acidoferrum sp.]|nr:BamA/TamA family outer membrane protein [Candidatus Acidoferrum sp.]
MLLLFGGLYGDLAATLVEAQEAMIKQSADSPRRSTGGPPASSELPGQYDKPQTKGPQNGGAFVVAPLPISSPAVGSGIVPVLAYIFSTSTNDRISPPSVVGAVGLVTNNGSRAIALGGEIYFKQNTYRTTAIYTRGNLNYDLYGLGTGDSQPRLPLKQTGQLVFEEFLRRTWWRVFLGPRFLWGSSLVTVRPNNVGTVPLPPDLGLDTNLTAVGFRLNRDTRPNRFYPTAGTFLDLTADFFSQGLGSKYSFQSYKLNFNKYWDLTQNQVLASGSFACFTGGEPPFYGNCIYGTNSQLRGYTAGRYLDRYMFGTQLEYRLALPKRFGVVGFGGLGEVIPGSNQPFRTKNFLPSGGGGVRFELSKKYHVNLRVDFAQAKDSNTWSVGVGESF